MGVVESEMTGVAASMRRIKNDERAARSKTCVVVDPIVQWEHRGKFLWL